MEESFHRRLYYGQQGGNLSCSGGVDNLRGTEICLKVSEFYHGVPELGVIGCGAVLNWYRLEFSSRSGFIDRPQDWNTLDWRKVGSSASY